MLRTTRLAVLLSLLGSASLAFGLNLSEAVNRGYVSIYAKSTNGFREVTLVITKKTALAFTIDFSTVYFTQANTSQRVGLTYEKSTLSYNLSFGNGTGTYTLIFDARCLDHNRPSPSTGQGFAKYAIFSAKFGPIVNALRSNYTQASVWSLTDDSGNLAAQWKAADGRPPIGGGGNSGGSELDIYGDASWRISGTTIRIKLARLDNRSTTWTTGSLRLRVWATRIKYTGGPINGYVMGESRLNSLRPNYHYASISHAVSYRRPPAGSYYTTLTVEEYSSSRWYIRDFINFRDKSRF